MTTNLSDVTAMLTKGTENYDTSRALELTKAITNTTATDLGCSEQDVTSLTRELEAAKDKATLVVKLETETAGSLSEALAKLCPASTTPTTPTTPTPTTPTSNPTGVN